MKLYNISGRISEGYTKYAGLFMLNDNKLEVIYFLNDDKENADDFIYEDLNNMAILGKKVFNIIKEFNIEDVEVLMEVDVDISLENWEFEFEEKFIEVIKNAEKESLMRIKELHAKVLQRIDEIEHDYGFTSVLDKYRSEADALLEKEASEEEFKKLIKKVQSCRSRIKKKSRTEMINIDKLDKKYMSDKVITKDDLSGASVEEVVDILKTIGLISWSAKEYGEPGYLNPDKEILFANWNYLDSDVREILEESGYSTEWDDEWVQANDEKAYRCISSQPGWMPYWFAYESDIYPIKGNEELFVKSITNNPKKVAPEWLDLEKFGFEKVINSDSGWYEQCKNIPPEKIAIKYAEGKDYVFKIDDLEPWCAEFSLWVKKEKDVS